MGNPFTYGITLTPAHRHIKRPELARALQNNAENHARLVLFGDRRIGKSSAVPLFLQDRKVLYIDCQGVRNTSDFIDRAFNAIAPMASSLAQSWDDLVTSMKEFSLSTKGMELSGSTKKDNLYALLRAFNRFGEKNEGATIFFDEFHELSMFAPKEEARSLLGILRGEIQRHPKTAYVFAGSDRQEMHAMFLGYGSPFYQSSQIFEVQPIPLEDMLAFIGEGLALDGRRIAAEHALTLVQVAGSSPNDIQHLAHYVWNMSTPGQVVDLPIIRRGLNQLLDHEDRYLADRLGHLQPIQERLLFLLACHETAAVTSMAFMQSMSAKSRPAASRAAKALCEGDEPFLYQKDRRYHFRDRFTYLNLVRRVLQRPALLELIGVVGAPAIDLGLSNLLVNRFYATGHASGSEIQTASANLTSGGSAPQG